MVAGNLIRILLLSHSELFRVKVSTELSVDGTSSFLLAKGREMPTLMKAASFDWPAKPMVCESLHTRKMKLTEYVDIDLKSQPYTYVDPGSIISCKRIQHTIHLQLLLTIYLTHNGNMFQQATLYHTWSDLPKRGLIHVQF